jgi:hypothetical protein
MKTARNTLFALLLLGGTAGATSASAQVAADIHIGPSGHASVDVGFFYDDLASYGNWVERPSYGWVWTPRAVAASWRPYQSGHWVLTDEGWTWISDEPYGWATYHYGRWYDDPEIGWSWVPGNEWAPSWVSWQEGADYIGWAPLPPGVNVGVAFGGSGYAYGIAPESYCFVQERNFLAPRLGAYFVARDRIGGFWGRTRNFTNYRFAGGRVFNQGVPVDRIQRFTGRVPRYQVADVSYARGSNNWRQARLQGNRVAIFRPQVQKAAHVAAPPNRAVARRAVINAAQFRAAHPTRVASAQRQERQAVQQQKAVQQRQAQNVRQQERTTQQRQAQNLRQQGRATQQRQAQNLRQQERATQQRQAQNVRQQERATQQRQAQNLRQQGRATQQRQAQNVRQQERTNQQRQAQNLRQQEKASQQRQAQASRQRERTNQQRQAQASRQQAHANQQRQAQSFRQQERGAQPRQAQAARQQQRHQAAQARGNGGGPRGQRQQAQGQGERRHGRPPGQ